MAAGGYSMLEASEEDAYHKVRLLPIELRPFQRITKRLLISDSPIHKATSQLPSLPSDASTEQVDADRERQAEEREKWRQEMLLDFAALQGTMVRIQLLRDSNIKERERYAMQKTKILETKQAIRDNTAELRIQLDEARTTMEIRKGWDALTDKILSNKSLKPREEQHANLDKLEQEIAELEREAQEYKTTWKERREQFGRIVDEGRQMLRLIRDEKEEAERKEGMADDGEGSDAENANSQIGSRQGTPRPDGSTPLHTSQPTGGSTPLRALLGNRLEVNNRKSQSDSHTGSRAGSQAGSQTGSRVGSPDRPSQVPGIEGREIDMADSPTGEVSDSIEEGEEEGEASPMEEKMDIT